MADALVQALMAREKDLYQKDPFLQGSGQIMSQRTMNPLDPWGSLAAALGQGFAGGIMQGYGKDQVYDQLAQDRRALYDDVITGRIPAEKTVWGREYQPFLDAYAQDQIEEQQAKQDKEQAFKDALYKIKFGKDYDLSLVPEKETEKYKVKIDLEPKLNRAIANEERNRTREDDEFVWKHEDEARDELTKSEAGKKVSMIFPLLEQVRRSINIPDRSADLQAVVGIAKLIDPTAMIRNEDVEFNRGIDSSIKQFWSRMGSELKENGVLSQDSKEKLFRMGTDLYSTQKDEYERQAKQVLERTKERTQGRARDTNILPIPLSTGRTGWATDRTTGKRVYFNNGQIIYQSR